MVIVQLTTDNREPFREYDKTEPWFGTAPEALLQGFANLSEIKVHVVTCTQRPMRSPEKLAENIWFHSLHVPKLGWMRTGFQGCIRAARRKIHEIRPDIVHGQGTERDCGVSAAYSGFPNVLTIHGNMRLISEVTGAKPFSYQWLAARFENFTIPRVGGVVCITRYTQHAVRSLARRTWVVPNAVDASFFDVSRARPENSTILCVGVICPRKNQLRLIEALDGLADRLHVRVRFLGAVTNNAPYVNEFFRRLKTRPWCEHGLASREQLKIELSQATMLVLPSLEDNCPMAVLEAMATRVPVVAANVGGVPDLIEDGITGLFCNALDPATIRDAVEQLLQEPSAAVQMAERAYISALQRFHPRAVARQHLNIYEDVLRTCS
jgi:glycosyltransferase involved in cell wall biosynthesis